MTNTTGAVKQVDVGTSHSVSDDENETVSTPLDWTFDLKESKLGSCNLKSILTGFKNKSYKKIIVMTGAGISCSAGIPDFRTPGTGLYSQMEEYDLPFPEAVFYFPYFKEHPEPFYRLCKNLWPDDKFTPTFGHFFIKKLEEMKILKRLYTQNIDGLERLAKIDSKLLVEAHGSAFANFRCLECGAECQPNDVKEELMNENVIRCHLLKKREMKSSKRNEECNGLVKPSIVFFGESLPMDFHNKVQTDFNDCDLLIIIGTSLKVSPFCNLVSLVDKDVPRVLINLEAVGANLLDYDSFSNKRDIALLGDIDTVLREITTELGWKDYIEAKVNETKKKQEVYAESSLKCGTSPPMETQKVDAKGSDVKGDSSDLKDESNLKENDVVDSKDLSENSEITKD